MALRSVFTGLSVSLLLLPACAEGRDIGGVRLGMSLAEARAILSRTADVHSGSEKALTTLSNGTIEVSGCGDVVEMVSRPLGLGFSKFSRAATVAQDSYGNPGATRVSYVAPVASGASAFSGISLQWIDTDGSRFFVTYNQSGAEGSEGLATEALMSKRVLSLLSSEAKSICG